MVGHARKLSGGLLHWGCAVFFGRFPECERFGLQGLKTHLPVLFGVSRAKLTDDQTARSTCWIVPTAPLFER